MPRTTRSCYELYADQSGRCQKPGKPLWKPGVRRQPQATARAPQSSAGDSDTSVSRTDPEPGWYGSSTAGPCSRPPVSPIAPLRQRTPAASSQHAPQPRTPTRPHSRSHHARPRPSPDTTPGTPPQSPPPTPCADPARPTTSSHPRPATYPKRPPGPDRPHPSTTPGDPPDASGVTLDSLALAPPAQVPVARRSGRLAGASRRNRTRSRGAEGGAGGTRTRDRRIMSPLL